MRFTRCQKIILFALTSNVVLFIYFAVLQHYNFTDRPESDRDHLLEFDKKLQIGENENHSFLRVPFKETEIAKFLTIIIREFEDFENNVLSTISHLQKLIKGINIIVISDRLPYPPLTKPRDLKNVKFVTLNLMLDRSAEEVSVRGLIKTDYVLFVPDGVVISSLQEFYKFLIEFNTYYFTKAMVVKTGKQNLTCPEVVISIKKWTLEMRDFTGSEGSCDFVEGDQAILLRTSDLADLQSPFTVPLSMSLYIQFVIRKWKILVYKKNVFLPRKELKDPHSSWKHKHNEEARKKSLMQKFGLKQLVYNMEKKVLYGCNKDTERCFQTVINDVPDFIQENKWTPPCCLQAVRETAKHVFRIFNQYNLRYWLEGGSLLGAVRHKDIIPWDYDVDVGIYKEDILKCPQLMKVQGGPFIDDGGFQWEKAEEGDFYRVHYSDINRNHVDIFPFYPKNGVMTKNTWFKTHRQDTEFPELYLKPLTTIEFIGMNVSAPNSVKSFLEYKFGKGVIENPRYPNNIKAEE